jgi:hypothetical protein
MKTTVHNNLRYNRIIFMRLRLRGKLLMRLRTTAFSKPTFLNEFKLTISWVLRLHMIEIVENLNEIE